MLATCIAVCFGARCTFKIRGTRSSVLHPPSWRSFQIYRLPPSTTILTPLQAPFPTCLKSRAILLSIGSKTKSTRSRSKHRMPPLITTPCTSASASLPRTFSFW
ncbi:hypothetical protein FIBSPDRAFT_394466 [Athelia psychrophila]|uniref:Uncharacterized protein n=1 Tax=Athelia psychrophila TaxID=1759441 RepID=A0A166NM43_9AGAM|nr:hypothetical protein FIBSPDRAFT_394466 [Fibularhizoctonia sp. CBS 109695]